MREFNIRKGVFEGIHIIYDSVKEYYEDNFPNPSKPIRWGSTMDLEKGDFVISDDGYVLRVLSTRIFPNARAISGQYSLAIRFPMGTWVLYKRKDGSIKANNFYAQFASQNKSSMSSDPQKWREKEFFLKIKSGMDTYEAFISTFKPKGSKERISFLLDNFLNKRMTEFMEAYQNFQKSLDQKVKELSGGKDIKSILVEKMAKIIVDDSSPRESLNQLKWLKEVFSENPNVGFFPKKIPSSEEVPPPELAEYEERSEDNANRYIISPSIGINLINFLCNKEDKKDENPWG